MADSEIKYTSRQWETNGHRFAIRVSVGESESDAPQIGELFGSDSGPTARRCVRVEIDRSQLPGLYLFRAIYRGFKGV